MGGGAAEMRIRSPEKRELRETQSEHSSLSKASTGKSKQSYTARLAKKSVR